MTALKIYDHENSDSSIEVKEYTDDAIEIVIDLSDLEDVWSFVLSKTDMLKLIEKLKDLQ